MKYEVYNPFSKAYVSVGVDLARRLLRSGYTSFVEDGITYIKP